MFWSMPLAEQGTTLYISLYLDTIDLPGLRLVIWLSDFILYVLVPQAFLMSEVLEGQLHTDIGKVLDNNDARVAEAELPHTS